MFETSVIRAHATTASHRYRLFTLSLAFHGSAIAAVLAATLASVRLPDEAPRQMAVPILVRPVTLPPALGTPAARPRSAAPATQRMIVAPTVIPSSGGQPNPALQPAETDSGGPVSSTGNGEGPVGVENGTPGGIGTDTSAITQAASDVPLQITGDVKAPIVLQRVIPEYPRVAMMSRMNGSVTVECIIDKTGHIRDARVIKSSFAAFDQPALDAVQKWVFAPGTLHGQPVDTIFDLTVVFQVR